MDKKYELLKIELKNLKKLKKEITDELKKLSSSEQFQKDLRKQVKKENDFFKKTNFANSIEKIRKEEKLAKEDYKQIKNALDNLNTFPETDIFKPHFKLAWKLSDILDRIDKIKIELKEMKKNQDG